MVDMYYIALHNTADSRHYAVEHWVTENPTTEDLAGKHYDAMWMNHF